MTDLAEHLSGGCLQVIPALLARRTHLSYQSLSSCCSLLRISSSFSSFPRSSFRSGLRSPSSPPFIRASAGLAHWLDFQEGVSAGLASGPAKRTATLARNIPPPPPPPLPARTGVSPGVLLASHADPAKDNAGLSDP